MNLFELSSPILSSGLVKISYIRVRLLQVTQILKYIHVVAKIQTVYTDSAINQTTRSYSVSVFCQEIF